MNEVLIQTTTTQPTAPAVRIVNMSNNNRRSHPVGLRVNQNPQSARRRRSPRFIVFERQRQKFVARVYLLSIAFISLTVLQWVCILSNPIFVEFFEGRYYISLMAGLTALLLITFFALFFEIRYIEPYNWIFAYLTVELETFALLRAPLDSDMSEFVTCLIATITINATFIFIGKHFPRDLTQDIMVLMVVSLLFYVTASIVLILLIATEVYYLRLFLIIGTIFLLVVYIMYVSQLIEGNRSGSLRWSDFILAALMVYFNFMLTFSSMLHLSNELFYKVNEQVYK